MSEVQKIILGSTGTRTTKNLHLVVEVLLTNGLTVIHFFEPLNSIFSSISTSASRDTYTDGQQYSVHGQRTVQVLEHAANARHPSSYPSLSTAVLPASVDKPVVVNGRADISLVDVIGGTVNPDTDGWIETDERTV